MRRREFIARLSSAAMAWPLALHAQRRTTEDARIGVLLVIPLAGRPAKDAFVAGLQELGYRDGKNIFIEYRSADGDLDRLAPMASDLVSSRLDVIVASSTPAALAAKQATATIPIVFVNVSDPVGIGLIAEYGQPGGNITGVSNIGIDLAAKRMQLLKEAVPSIRRVGVYVSEDPNVSKLQPEIERAAKALKIGTVAIEFKDRDGLGPAMARAKSSKIDGLYVVESVSALNVRALLAEFEMRTGLPGVFPASEYAEAGGMLSYGANIDSNWRRVATFVDKILKGKEPREIPAERASTFELVVNLRTARKLGVAVPPPVLQRADRVIE